MLLWMNTGFVFHLEGWNQIPGKEMTSGSGELAGSRVLTVTGSRMEFVINNTEGGWCVADAAGFMQSSFACKPHDTRKPEKGGKNRHLLGRDTPPTSSGKKNYIIDSPGKYLLQSGKVIAMS